MSASRSGTHTYSRFDVIRTIEAVLGEQGFLPTGKETDALYIRADIDGSCCRISIKLTDAEFRFRGNGRVFLKGGIRPTVAAALVRISKPCKNDVFYDPFCGSGTIPSERAHFSARRILASDLEEGAVLAANENGKGSVIVFHADARRTPSQLLEPRYYVGPIITDISAFGIEEGAPSYLKTEANDIAWFFHVVDRMKEVIGDWDMPPLIVQYEAGQYEICDGRHRNEALHQMNIKHAPVIFWTSVEEDHRFIIEQIRRTK